MRQIANAFLGTFVHGESRDGFPIEKYLPRIGLDHPDYGIKGGRFPCPVGAEKSHDFPLVDIKAYIVDDFSTTVFFDNALDFQPHRGLGCASLLTKILASYKKATGIVTIIWEKTSGGVMTAANAKIPIQECRR